MPVTRYGASASLQFTPQDIVLTSEPSAGSSARNRLHGRVRELVVLPGQIFVSLDVGQFLWAEVTVDAVQELGLQANKRVTCLIKTTTFVVLK